MSECLLCIISQLKFKGFGPDNQSEVGAYGRLVEMKLAQISDGADFTDGHRTEISGTTQWLTDTIPVFPPLSSANCGSGEGRGEDLPSEE